MYTADSDKIHVHVLSHLNIIVIVNESKLSTLILVLEE